MRRTIAEKILSDKAVEGRAETGEVVVARVDKCMSHENAALVSRIFRKMGGERVWDPSRIVIIFDHRVPADSVKTAEGQKEVREFIREQGIKNFYDINHGICHQVMVEEGHAGPGMLIVGTDSHTTTYGALGTASTGIGATDMASVWCTGRIWLRVPETLRIQLTGEFRSMVTSKDLILRIIGELGSDGADYRAVEFCGEALEGMTLASRLVLSNLSMEMGAKFAFALPESQIPERYRPDPDAEYEDRYSFDLSEVGYTVACPHSVDNTKPVEEVAGTEIHQAFLGSCTNGRLEDFEAAARILRGRKVADGVRLIAIPASWNIYLEAVNRGYLQTIIEAGGVIVNPGCGPCLGAHQGLLASGERAITTTNRNFRGRMGSPEAEVYLASPYVVAASAVLGRIASPEEVMG